MKNFNLRTAERWITSTRFGRSLLGLKDPAELAGLLTTLALDSLTVDGLSVTGASAWQPLTLASANWTQIRTPQWRINAGRVELRGFLTRTTSTFTANGTLFTLGAAANPPVPSQAYTVHGAAGIAAATPDATVVVWQVDAGAGTFRSSALTHAVAVGDTVSLDGICWPIN